MPACSQNESRQKEEKTSSQADTAPKQTAHSPEKEQALIGLDRSMQRKLKIAKLIVLNIRYMEFPYRRHMFYTSWGI